MPADLGAGEGLNQAPGDVKVHSALLIFSTKTERTLCKYHKNLRIIPHLSLGQRVGSFLKCIVSKSYEIIPASQIRDLEILFFLLAVPGILSDPNSPSVVRARSPDHWECPT